MAGSLPDSVSDTLAAARAGDQQAGEDLIKVVYTELRRLAQAKMSHEAPGHTLQATALVHEAYVRLVGENDPGWDSRTHFFGAAAEAMRRILIERARRQKAAKHGGGRQRVPLDQADLGFEAPSTDIEALHEALADLEKEDPRAAEIVRFRTYLGMNHEQIAKCLGVSKRTVRRDWEFARIWLYKRLGGRSDMPRGDANG